MSALDWISVSADKHPRCVDVFQCTTLPIEMNHCYPSFGYHGEVFLERRTYQVRGDRTVYTNEADAIRAALATLEPKA